MGRPGLGEAVLTEGGAFPSLNLEGGADKFRKHPNPNRNVLGVTFQRNAVLKPKRVPCRLIC